MRIVARFLSPALVVTALALPWPATADEGGLEHFEKRIRPVLVEKCHGCHSAQAPSVFANLRLDSFAGLLKGGDSGPAVVPGDPAGSLVMRAVRGDGKTLMPPTGRLSDMQIADIESWIRDGAPWPEEQGPGLPDPSEAFDLERRRAEHWAWQPVRVVDPPTVADLDWPQSTIDRFILAGLEGEGLSPAPPADRYTLLRRLSFALTGLPPTQTEIDAFLADNSPRAVEEVVERLLGSPHFGERWARHWMDLVRYTESHGSEGDPDLPEAWRYRDYLIRALNADIPYDQLIREHLAGDLLPEPRLNRADGLNESLLATAHYRMIEHGFQPVEPWEDRVKWTDNQIDVFSKAFQGLTVSCARCHDHKFDAISQRDYYALFGVFASARPVQRAVDTPDLLHKHVAALGALKSRVRETLAASWLGSADDLAEALRTDDSRLASAIEESACDSESPLYPWVELAALPAEELRSGWSRLVDQSQRDRAVRQSYNGERFKAIWRLSPDTTDWKMTGTGVEAGATPPGEFSINPSGDRIMEGIYEQGVYSGLLSRRHDAVLQTPRFTVDTDRISFRVQGTGVSFVRLIVENYAVPRSGIYWQRYSPKKDEPVWSGWDTTYWKGFSAYLEFSTARDSTNFHLDPEHSRQKPRPAMPADGRSHFGAIAVAFHDAEVTPKPVETALSHLFGGVAPRNAQELADIYGARLRNAIDAWRDGAMTASQAAFLDWFVRRDLLPRSLGLSEHVDDLVSEYRRLEAEVPIFRRAPSVLDEEGPDQELLIRGDHRRRGDPVPRAFLTALGGEPYSDRATARLRLAEDVTAPRNPLTARVFVNRVWQHLFGRGLVATVDNFGRLGEAPSHPALLDYLADGFVRDGWSIKSVVRRMVLTSTYQQSSEPSALAARIDPGNALLQHMPVRRLDGEAIRDTVLTVSGRLDPSLHGPSVDVYYGFAKGKTKGDRVKGPLDGDGRRSVYQEIRRNAHNPFLEVFDQPKPATTRGARDQTNVPAQSLTMLNSPLVQAQAQVWGNALAARAESDSDTVRSMFLAALGRPPEPLELDRSLGYVGANADAGRWTDLAHAIFNLKEFLYIR